MTTYKILQAKDIETCLYAFRNWECASAKGFSLDDYKVVYEAPIGLENCREAKLTLLDICEILFVKFNCERPKDFYGHSLSVSDCIMIGDKLFYCDLCGWTRIK